MQGPDKAQSGIQEQVPAIISSFRSMLIILELMMNVSHCTAKAERSFSCMNLLKTLQRQSMTQDLLKELMVISMEGPNLTEYSPQAIEDW